jgi:hypothetical protein
MAGATSATLVVHDTIAARPSSTSDNIVNRKTFNSPPTPDRDGTDLDVRRSAAEHRREVAEQ